MGVDWSGRRFRLIRVRFSADKFPTPLFVRTLAFGAILGTVEGGLRIAQEKIRSLKESEGNGSEGTAEDVATSVD